MYFAKHSQRFSHDAPTRYLKRDRVKPNQIWQQSKQEIVISPNGYLVFDDSVLDKNHSREIALVHRQFSGNEHRVIRGIGMAVIARKLCAGSKSERGALAFSSFKSVIETGKLSGVSGFKTLLGVYEDKR
jgi:predicted house-cleaning NTP pyrophosphatase (Maf/HAM1 superfamily)